MRDEGRGRNRGRGVREEVWGEGKASDTGAVTGCHIAFRIFSLFIFSLWFSIYRSYTLTPIQF